MESLQIAESAKSPFVNFDCENGFFEIRGRSIIENTFSLNGMGKLYWQGLNNMDFELVLAIQMFYSIVSLVGSLLIDISYGLVDPRVRVDK